MKLFTKPLPDNYQDLSDDELFALRASNIVKAEAIGLKSKITMIIGFILIVPLAATAIFSSVWWVPIAMLYMANCIISIQYSIRGSRYYRANNTMHNVTIERAKTTLNELFKEADHHDPQHP